MSINSTSIPASQPSLAKPTKPCTLDWALEDSGIDMTKGSKCKQRCSELGVQFNEALKAATTQVPIVTSAKVAVHPGYMEVAIRSRRPARLTNVVRNWLGDMGGCTSNVVRGVSCFLDGWNSSVRHLYGKLYCGEEKCLGGSSHRSLSYSLGKRSNTTFSIR